MNVDKLNNADIFVWIKNILETETLGIYNVEIKGKSEVGDGYLGDIIFVDVHCKTIKNEEEVLSLVIKHGKINDHLRKTTPIRDVFKKEIYIYQNIIPTFKNFQIEKYIKHGFDSIPKCFGSLILDKMEVIVLENLKEIGYELYNRKIPLTIDHQKLVLREYGKLHALTFAFRDQKPEKFESLISDFPKNALLEFLKDESIKKNIENMVCEAKNSLRTKDDFELYEKYCSVLGKDIGGTLIEILDKPEPQSAILHGDCWNNNFLFKYKDSDKRHISNLAILDWQLSSIHSPVIDLSYFIYSTGSKKEIGKLGELINEYYSSFSTFLGQLGSNPDSVFPFSSFINHWKKYSLFGLIMMPAIVPLAMSEKEDVRNIEDITEGENFGELFKFKIRDKDSFRERFIASLDSYFNYVF